MGCLLCCTSILNTPSPVSTECQRPWATCCQRRGSPLETLSLRSLWSGVLGTVGIRVTNSRMRLPSRPLLTLRRVQRGRLDCFFLARLAPSERLQFPTIVDEEVLSSKEVASIFDSSAKNVSVGSALRTMAISLGVASANVNTLSPCDDCAGGPTLSVTGRILALQSQSAQRGLRLVGIQEGRMRTSTLHVCPGYFCIVSPANANGCLGCELTH